MEKPNITESIRKARLMLGLSQENVADQLGISTTTYGDIERGKTTLTLTRAMAIAEVLRLDWQTLLPATTAVSAVTTTELEALQEAYQTLEEEKRQLETEVRFWREKFEERVLLEAYRLLKQQQRNPIGFK